MNGAAARVRRRLRAIAGMGAAAATVLGLRAGTLRPEAIVAFASLAIVPLGFALANHDRQGERSALERVVAVMIPVGSIGALASWLAPVGSHGAVVGAAVYLATCSGVGAFGLRRILLRGLAPFEESVIDFGLAFLPLGAGWMLASRAGMQLMGFNDLVVLLTAAHFHFAGFAAPIAIGCAGRLTLSNARAPRRAFRIAALAICGGVPLTAIGIATTRAVETASALVLAAGILVAAWVLVRDASREASRTSPIAATLWAVSGTSLLLTMALAATFAVTGSAGRNGSFSPVVSFDRMLAFHGAVNAFGFVTAALIAASILDVPARDRAKTEPP